MGLQGALRSPELKAPCEDLGFASPHLLLPRLQRLSAWAELLGYVGSIAIKLEEVAKIESSIKKRLAKDCDKDSEAVKTM